MKQKDFLVWMLTFPIVCSFQKLVTEYLIGRTYPLSVEGISAGITLALYFTIGALLWNKKDS